MHSQLLQVWHYQGHQTLSWLAGSALMTWLASRWWTMNPLAHAGHVWERQQADQTRSLFESMACMSLWCPGQPFEIWHSQDDLNIVRDLGPASEIGPCIQGCWAVMQATFARYILRWGPPCCCFGLWKAVSPLSPGSLVPGPWQCTARLSSCRQAAVCCIAVSQAYQH